MENAAFAAFFLNCFTIFLAMFLPGHFTETPSEVKNKVIVNKVYSCVLYALFYKYL